jgi:hypothetical protein
MGATSWRYYTPYDPDPAKALTRLRDDVFARGEYVDLTQVEARWADAAEPLRRDHACYLVIFRGGQPDEYVFIGVSGD